MHKGAEVQQSILKIQTEPGLDQDFKWTSHFNLVR